MANSIKWNDKVKTRWNYMIWLLIVKVCICNCNIKIIIKTLTIKSAWPKPKSSSIPCGVVGIFHIGYTNSGIRHPVIDHCVNGHCHRVFGQHLKEPTETLFNHKSKFKVIPPEEEPLEWLSWDPLFDRFLCRAEQKIFLKLKKIIHKKYKVHTFSFSLY